MHRNYTRQTERGSTSHAGVDACSDVHSYLVCQDRVLLLSKCLSRGSTGPVGAAQRTWSPACLQIKLQKVLQRSITVLVPAAHSILHPILPRGELYEWTHPGLYVPLILVLGNCGDWQAGGLGTCTNYGPQWPQSKYPVTSQFR